MNWYLTTEQIYAVVSKKYFELTHAKVPFVLFILWVRGVNTWFPENLNKKKNSNS